jgi:hypothetical protein
MTMTRSSACAAAQAARATTEKTSFTRTRFITNLLKKEKEKRIVTATH